MRQSKTLQHIQDMNFVASFTKHFDAKTRISIREKVYSPEQIVTIVRRQVDAQTAVERARGEYARAVKAAIAVRAEVKQVYDGAKQFAHVAYEGNPAVLSSLGLSPRKQGGAKDIATKQAAVDQMRATRAARHTKGKRQKAKIKGVVVATEVPEGPEGTSPRGEPEPT